MDDYKDYEEQEFEENDASKAPKKQAIDSKKSHKKTPDVNFEFGKTYRLNEDGSITEQESDTVLQDGQCGFLQTDCCTIKIPKGFQITPGSGPSACYDTSNLRCIKTPITTTVPLPACYNGDVKECNVVAGYEIRVVGSVTLVASLSIKPNSGVCFLGTPSNVGCSIVVPVSSVLAHSCNPTPCPNNNCYRITVYFTIAQSSSPCGDIYSFIFVTNIASSGSCA